MALNIRDREVSDLAREVADATGETMTQAVKTALRERLERVREVDATEQQRRYDAIMDFARRWREAPVLDPRPLRRDPRIRRERPAALMVIDTSAVMAILLDEADAAQYVTVMIRTPSLIMSAATYVEFGIIARSRQGFDAAAVDEALAAGEL